MVVGISGAELRAFEKAGMTPPAVIDTLPTAALLDTGAMRSFIPTKMVRELGLVSYSRATIHTPIAGAVSMPLYAVSLRIVERRPRSKKWRETALATTIEVGVIPENPGNSGQR